MENRQITFKDLEIRLKIAVVFAYIWGTFTVISFCIGLIAGLSGR